MGPFVRTSKVFVQWDRVREIKVDKAGQKTLVLDDGQEIPVGDFDLESVITEIIPATPGWEVIIPWPDENDAYSPEAFPVIAFGRTALGTTKPITAFDPQGVQGNYALRAPNDQRVTSSEGIFESAHAWFATVKGLDISGN